MNKKTIILSLFGCLALIQIAVPVSMIFRQEGVLGTGREFKFRTEPVDPFDAFRGRYVALALRERTAPNQEGLRLTAGQQVFAVINVAADGFAAFSRVTAVVPRHEPYLRVKVAYITGNQVHLRVPIDRYYMPERKAPRAEALYRQHNIRGDADAFVVVMIKDGNPVVKNLYVGGKSIEEALK